VKKRDSIDDLRSTCCHAPIKFWPIAKKHECRACGFICDVVEAPLSNFKNNERIK